MSIHIKPRLGRTDIMFNSFASCIPYTPEEFSWTPKMPFGKIISQPRMLPHEFKGTISFKQLESSAYRHCWRQLYKEMHMINCNTKLVDFTSMLDSNLIDKSLTISFDSIKLEWVPSIFWLPHEVEGILPEGMAKTLQIHFSAPTNIAHANSICLVQEAQHQSLFYNNLLELNNGGWQFLPTINGWVSLPSM